MTNFPNDQQLDALETKTCGAIKASGGCDQRGTSAL
jgi:hypothetical protein